MLNYPEAQQAYSYYERLLEENPDLPCPEFTVIDYNYRIQGESPHIDYDYAHHEIRQNLLNWVKVGIVAHKMKYLKLWKGKFSSFKDYCEKALEMRHWRINEYIKAAKVVLILLDEGFDTVPNCVAQAIEIFPYYQNAGREGLCAVWGRITREIPFHLISAMAIKKTLGHKMPKPKIPVTSELQDLLYQNALDRGLSVEEMLEEDYGLKASAEDESEPEATEINDEKITTWQDDLKSLVEEHDAGKWLLCVLAKLIRPLKNRDVVWGGT